MNCPMKKLLKELAATAASTAATTAASPASTPASTARKTSVYSCVNSVTDGKNQCECCALLAFKYIAACEDVVEFQRKVREVMRKR